MKIRNIEINRAQRGWVTEFWVGIETAGQCTLEYHEVVDGHKWLLISVWKAWRAAKRLNREIAAKPGERAAMGWN